MRQLRDAYDPRAVVRPTMVPDREEAAASGGHSAKMLDSGFNDPPAPPPDPLSASKPTLTGDPCVGYTLSCSEPVPAGGVAPYTFSYFWVDMTRDQKMAPTTIVTEYDLGKQMKCLVTVSDSAGESVQVETDPTIQAFRPTLGDFATYVDNVLIDQTTVGVTPNQLCVCLVQEDDPVLFPPKDVSFDWELRSGTGSLRGDNGLPYMSYLAPGAAPGGALVTCTIISNDAQDATDVVIEFLVADGP